MTEEVYIFIIRALTLILTGAIAAIVGWMFRHQQKHTERQSDVDSTLAAAAATHCGAEWRSGTDSKVVELDSRCRSLQHQIDERKSDIDALEKAQAAAAEQSRECRESIRDEISELGTKFGVVDNTLQSLVDEVRRLNNGGSRPNNRGQPKSDEGE